MKNKKLLGAFDLVEEKYIAEADPDSADAERPATAGKRGRIRIKSLVLIAASLCLVTALSLTLFLPFSSVAEKELKKYEDDPYYDVIAKLSAMDVRDNEPKNNFEVLLDKLGTLFSGGIKDGADLADRDFINSAPGDSGIAKDDLVANGTAQEGANGAYEETTDNQVDGVVEADLIKRTDKYIFYLDADYGHAILRIYSIAQEDSEEIAYYKLTFNDKADDVLYQDIEFYLSKDANTITLVASGYSRELGSSYIELIALDVSNVTDVKPKSSVVFTGNYVSSRNTDGNILLISQFMADSKPDFSDRSTFLPQMIVNGETTSIAPEDIVLPEVLDSRMYTIVTMLDEDDLSVKGNVAYLSFSNNHYVSEDTVYITRSYIEERAEGDIIHQGPVTEIVPLGYDADGFEKKQSVTVEGRVKDQYSLDQHEGILRVVTTTETAAYKEAKKNGGLIMREYIDRGESNAALWCIDLDTMKVIASVEDFAPDGETVESVRFDGDHAYVCTAVVVTLTDPVFFFDLSDLDNITYTDTGKIDGYSSSLVDFGDGYLLGIGFGNDRFTLKIEMYCEDGDGVVSIASYELPETSFSGDYKAYFIDRENGLVGLGVNTYDFRTHRWDYKYILLHFNGYKFVEKVNTVFGSDFNAMRADYIDNYFYMLDGGDFKVVQIFGAGK